MPKRKEHIILTNDKIYNTWEPSSNIQLTFTRLGLEVFGWYDTYVGIGGTKLIAWQEIEEIKKKLFTKGA